MAFQHGDSTIGMVLNECMGGFGLSEYAKNKLGIKYVKNRFDINLVNLVLEEPDKVGDYSSKLKVVYMPREYHEGPEDGHGRGKKYYRIDEYDGSETLILYPAKYQRDQKIKKQTKIISDIEKELYSDDPENLRLQKLKSIISSKDDKEEYFPEEQRL